MAYHSSPGTDTTSYATFSTRFWKNLEVELKRVVRLLMSSYRMVTLTTIGVFLFIFEFSVVQNLLKIILPPFFIYLCLKYLTVFPIEIFFILIFLPVKWVRGILLIGVIYSFFITFFI